MSLNLNPSISSIARKFYALRLPQDEDFPQNGQELQTALLQDILESELYRSYPPAANYQRVFWKRAITRLESCDDLEEIDSRVYDALLALMACDSSSPRPHVQGPPPPSFLTHFWRLPGSGQLATTTLLESRMTVEAGTTGLHTWGASLALCQHLQAHPETVQGKRVLELGCGVGLLGAVVARLGAQMTILTDCSQEVLERCRDNIQRAKNVSETADVHLAQLDWFDALDDTYSLSARIREWDPHIVLGADIVYDPEIIPPLAQTLRLMLTSRTRIKSVLLALTVRRQETFDAFVSALEPVGLRALVQELQVDPDGDFLCTASETDKSSRVMLLDIKSYSNKGHEQ